jgi:hypothetical protein
MIELLTITIPQGTDHLPIWPTRVFNVVSCVALWLLALFVSYCRAHPTSFSFGEWWRDDRPRFRAGLIITVLVVILKATSNAVDDMLKLLGFEVTNASGVAYGFAIATVLMSFQRVRKNGKLNEKNRND